jgi:MFS family permease
VGAGVLGLVLLGASSIAMALSPSVPWVLASISVFGVSLPILIVSYMTLLQRRTPQRLMARVSVAAEVVMSVPSAASLALGALLVTIVDWRIIFVVIGVFTLAGAGHVAYWLRDVIRHPGTVEPATGPLPGPEPTPLDPGSTVTPT